MIFNCVLQNCDTAVYVCIVLFTLTRYEMLEMLKKFGTVPTSPPPSGGGGGGRGGGGSGGIPGATATKELAEKKAQNGIGNSTIENSASINSISSVGSNDSATKMTHSPSLERLPSYLMRKGKKKKSKVVDQDANYKPIKVAPTSEFDDFTVPDFLKMKNIKNVVSAVNEMKKSTRRRLSGPIAEALIRKAQEMGESQPEGIAEEDENEDGYDDDTSSVETRRQESVDSSIDAMLEGRDNMGLITEEIPEERRNSDVSRSGSGRAPLRREKAFANDDAKADDGVSDPNDRGATSPENGDSQSTSGIASPNNSFQSQDSSEVDGQADKDGILEEDDDGEGMRSLHDSGHVPDGELAGVMKPAKRKSYLWTEKKDKSSEQDVEMTTRYVYNGIQDDRPTDE